ncbi:13615_t:CDS:2, partial [Funneliformis mosseae]
LPPHNDLTYNPFLMLRICQGLRPTFKNNFKVPPLVKELIDRCLTEDPSMRPTANELNNTFLRWYRSTNKNDNAEFRKQCKEADEHNSLYFKSKSKASNTSAHLLTSKSLYVKDLECSESLNMDFTKKDSKCS